MSAEFAALSSARTDVTLVRTDTDDRENELAYGLRAALRVASGLGSDPRARIEELRPDVVHVHNLFPNWGDRWLGEMDVPVVNTLHNYRPMCAAGTLYRDGQVCTLCVDGNTRPALRHACYRGSRIATAPLAVRNRGGAASDRVLQSSDRVVTLSRRMRDLYARSGVDERRLVVWPNFLPDRLDPGRRSPTRQRDSYLFVGRFSGEKGIDLLLRRWPTTGPTLDVVGDGPLLDSVSQAAASNPLIRVRGRQPREAVLDAMAAATALIIPSRWYEGFPVIYAEALAAGLPVLTFEPCNVVEFVTEDNTGGVLRWDAPVGEQLPDRATIDTWATRCRDVFEAKYTEAAYVERALALYGEVV